jgi:NAD(P)H-hydrate epimerase
VSAAASSDLAGRLADLFRETGAAHHRAFSHTDGADPEWPMWYATYLRERLSALVGRSPTLDDLADFLVRADEECSALSPRPDWPAFYAERFLRRFT